MMLEIRNFRAVERADILLSGIALVAGKNAAGKSSVCMAAAAAFTGDMLPIGLGKSRAGAMVRAGADTATATVRVDGVEIKARWPSCERTTTGTPPEASAIAAGTQSVVDMDVRERATYLAALLKTDPTRDDLVNALADAGATTVSVMALWAAIEESGWNGAHKRAQECGSKLKGAWEQAAGDGERYGAAKAEDWMPPGWSAELSGLPVTALEEKLAADKKALETAIASGAAAQEKRAALAGRIAAAETLAGELVEREAVAKAARQAHEKAMQARQALPAAEETGSKLTCPHCQGAVMLVKGVLMAHGFGLSPAELAMRRHAIASADGVVANKRDHTYVADKQVAEARAAAETLAKAKAELDALPMRAGGPAGDVDALRERISQTERDLAAARKRVETQRIHGEIVANQKAVSILAPDGLRKAKLTRVLALFNTQRVDPLCRAASYKSVEIQPDLSVTMGGRAYGLLSSSEQWRVRAVLAVAAAQIDESDILILDGADILDAGGRNGLFRMLRAADIPALVGMTIGSRDQVPDLAAAKLGRSYWIENGKALEIQKEAA